MNLAKMAYNKLKAVEEDKKCLHCGKMAKEGCECPDEAPEGYEEEGDDEEEMSGIGRGEMDSGEGESEKEQEITININVGKR